MYYKTGSKPKEKILTLRVNASLIERVDKVAMKLGMTRSELIKKAIEKALEDSEKEGIDKIIDATALMMLGKSMRLPPEAWENIERKLKSSPPLHKTLKGAMEFIRGRDWEES